MEVRSIALTMDQIKLYNPPPNPAKITDPRAKGYIKEFGAVSWELDALTPEVLRGITADAILEYLDESKYNTVIAEENKGIKILRDFGKTLK